MKIYLAARYPRLQELNTYRREIEDIGHVVTSRWLTGTHNGGSLTGLDLTPPELERFAYEDLQDVNDADLVISFTEQGNTPRGGRHVEFGYALALGKELWVTPYRENIFHYVPRVRCFDHWKDVWWALVERKFEA